MNIIDMGLNKRFDTVIIEADNDSEALVAYNQMHELLDQLAVQLGDRTPLWLDIESAINQYAVHYGCATYRMGLSDGMKLQQEINGLLQGGSR